MVSGSEELVSTVLRIQNSSHVKCPFPLTIAVPFQARYRGNYREITMKVVDPEQRVSYVTPTSTEGFYGGQRVCIKAHAVLIYILFSVIYLCCKRLKIYKLIIDFHRFLQCSKVDLICRCTTIACMIFVFIVSFPQGWFAVVRVYSLGVFAVLSRLRTESFTVPRTGLSHKLSVDSRICLDYLPGSFIAPVVAQVTVHSEFLFNQVESQYNRSIM